MLKFNKFIVVPAEGTLCFFFSLGKEWCLLKETTQHFPQDFQVTSDCRVQIPDDFLGDEDVSGRLGRLCRLPPSQLLLFCLLIEILHLPQGWPQSPLSREDFPQESCGTWSSPCCLGIPAASDTIRLESLLPCLCLIFCECTFASPVVLSFAFNLQSVFQRNILSSHLVFIKALRERYHRSLVCRCIETQREGP